MMSERTEGAIAAANIPDGKRSKEPARFQRHDRGLTIILDAAHVSMG